MKSGLRVCTVTVKSAAVPPVAAYFTWPRTWPRPTNVKFLVATSPLRVTGTRLANARNRPAAS